MSKRLFIAPSLLDEIRAAARRAHPEECCGLIEGDAEEGGWRASAVHEARNVAVDRERNFLIDPELHLHLLRTLRGTERAIIGCFHSHPSGFPGPSETDRLGAVDDDYVWVVVSPQGIRAYVFNATWSAFTAVEIVGD